MPNNLVKITLCDELAKEINKGEWYLNIKSVPEAFEALDILTNKKFLQIIRKKAEAGEAYAIYVNGDLIDEKDSINIIYHEDELRSIEIVPAMIGGIHPLLLAIIIAVLSTLLSWGLNKLLNPTPENKKADVNPSYLINGTANLAKQGLPIPVGYGRKLVGSQVISYSTRYINDGENLTNIQKYEFLLLVKQNKDIEPFAEYYSLYGDKIEDLLTKGEGAYFIYKMLSNARGPGNDSLDMSMPDLDDINFNGTVTLE